MLASPKRTYPTTGTTRMLDADDDLVTTRPGGDVSTTQVKDPGGIERRRGRGRSRGGCSSRGRRRHGARRHRHGRRCCSRVGGRSRAAGRRRVGGCGGEAEGIVVAVVGEMVATQGHVTRVRLAQALAFLDDPAGVIRWRAGTGVPHERLGVVR